MGIEAVNHISLGGMRSASYSFYLRLYGYYSPLRSALENVSVARCTFNPMIFMRLVMRFHGARATSANRS
jgi:hypothetical protein